MDKPNCKFNTQNFAKNAAKCVVAPSVPNCVVKPIVTATLDPCVQQHMAYQTTQDPYYQHMPKNGHC